MSKQFVNKFLSDLQKQYLKPLGYKKEGHTFIRSFANYNERINVQGSSWNSPDSPWRFYINVGVQFHDLSRRVPDRDFPNTHAHGRIERVLKNCHPYFDLTESNSIEMMENISDLIVQASSLLNSEVQLIYSKCKSGKVVCLGI